MALEHLIEVLRHEADLEVTAVLEAAGTEADAIRSRTEADLAACHTAFLAAREADRRSAVELALGTARRDARRLVLDARARLVERVFGAALARFSDVLTTAQYRAGLAAQLADALECLANRAGVVRCHSELVPELRRLAGTRSGIKVLPDPTISGFKVLSEDGTIMIDGTLEGCLKRREMLIKQDVLAHLEIRS